MKELGGSIGLILIGGAVLSISFPSDIINFQWLGWIPLLGGIGYLILKVRKQN